MVNLKEESKECVLCLIHVEYDSLTSYFEHILLYPMHKYAVIK